jgi:UDP-glucose 4-epimerase
MKTAVVVGANGFLGSALVNELIQREFEVIAVYHTSHDKINGKAKLYTNEELLVSNVAPDIIFYLSGNYANTHRQLLEINALLTQYTVKFNKAKMVYVSSTNVYGNSSGLITENSPYDNPGIYAQSKLSGEFIVKVMPHFAIVRLAYIYGPGITNSSFIPTIISSAIEQKKIILFGKGEREQDYIYIDDAVSICIASALNEANCTYLGATGISISNKIVSEEIQKYTDCIIEFAGEETGKSFYFNPQLTFDLLKWKPKTSFEVGIKKMLS